VFLASPWRPHRASAYIEEFWREAHFALALPITKLLLKPPCGLDLSHLDKPPAILDFNNSAESMFADYCSGE